MNIFPRRLLQQGEGYIVIVVMARMIRRFSWGNLKRGGIKG